MPIARGVMAAKPLKAAAVRSDVRVGATLGAERRQSQVSVEHQGSAAKRDSMRMARRGRAKAGHPLKDGRFVSCIRLFDRTL